MRHVLTIEVDLRRRTVVQARGWVNRMPSGKPLRLLQAWTARERTRGVQSMPVSMAERS